VTRRCQHCSLRAAPFSLSTCSPPKAGSQRGRPRRWFELLARFNARSTDRLAAARFLYVSACQGVPCLDILPTKLFSVHLAFVSSRHVSSGRERERARTHRLETRLPFLAEDHVVHPRHDAAVVALDDRCGGAPVFPLSSLPLQQFPAGARRFRHARRVRNNEAETRGIEGGTNVGQRKYESSKTRA